MGFFESKEKEFKDLLLKSLEDETVLEKIKKAIESHETKPDTTYHFEAKHDDSKEVYDLKQKNAELNKKLADYETILRANKNDIGDLSRKYQNLLTEDEALKTKLTEKNNLLKEVARKLNDFDGERRAFEHQTEELKQTIKELNSIIQKYEIENAHLRKKLGI